MDDLWGNIIIDDVELNDSKALEILKEQARILEKKTHGIIKATFSKIDYKVTPIDIFSQTLLSVAVTEREIIDLNLENKKDVNEIYTFVKYKFEIYNDTYRFRVFILKFRPIFPIEIEIDEGIREELGISSKELLINSDNELKKIVSDIFSSPKLQMIIKRMLIKNK